MSSKSTQPQVESWLCCTLTPELICARCGLLVCEAHSTVGGFREVWERTGPCPKDPEEMGHYWHVSPRNN